MVVRGAVTMGRHARKYFRPLLCAGVLFATIVPTARAAGSSLSSPALQLGAVAPSGSGNFLGLQQGAIAPNSYGNFAAPVGSPDPAWFALWSTVEPTPAMPGSDPAITALLNGTSLLDALLNGTGAAEFGVGGSASPASTVSEATAGGIHAVCGDDQLATLLQASGRGWTGQAVNTVPVQFPAGAFGGSSIEGDPTLGPGGDRSNVPPPGPGSAWCNPAPVPFDQSSPLETRALWIPVVVALAGFVIFWLSRGVRMPA